MCVEEHWWLSRVKGFTSIRTYCLVERAFSTPCFRGLLLWLAEPPFDEEAEKVTAHSSVVDV